jgi:hypothetical protein
MMKSFAIQIGNFDQKMVGYIILEFTYIRLNVDKKNYICFFKFNLYLHFTSFDGWCEIFFVKMFLLQYLKTVKFCKNYI